jgi:hypothetical protein
MPCGFCHQTGHNRTTCPTFRAIRERDTHQRNRFGRHFSQETLLRIEQERAENINTIDLTIPEVLPQTPPDTPPSIGLPQTPPPANYSTPNAPRMGRRGRRGGEWNINIAPMMAHLFNDDDEIYTPKKKQLVTCVECPCETTTCAICMEDLTQVDLMVTRCGHQFHSGCMITHLRKKDDCPLCRGILIA